MKGIQESQLSLFKSVSSVTSTNLLPIGMRQIDTPNDHNCLFWSAALGLLIPLLGENEADKARFNAMYSRLFGISGAITLKGKDDKDDAVLDIGTELTRENIRLALKTYDFSKEDPLRFIGNPLYHLIAEVFRRKVVEELPKVFSTSEQRTNIAIAESCSDWEGYLTKMVLPESWGGHPEIEAIAHLANVNITVYGSGMGYPRQYLIMGAVYTLCLAYVNAAGKGSTVKNHYHYGVPETIYETHLKKDTPSIRTDPDEKKKMVFISQHVPLQPMIPQLTGSPFGSQSSLVSLLKSSYEKRAEIRSLGFTDHALPISDVHFTIDQISEEQERECLKAQKDSKAGDSKSDRKPELRVVPVSAAAPQPVLVADIFSPLPQQGKTKEEKKETTDSKISATALSTKPIHRVLILGQAGSGKTTLSKYIAHQWVNGQLWHKRYHNVFWLTLRDLYSLSKKELEECVSSPLPLATLIHRLCLDEATRAKIGIKAIHCMLSDAPEKTLLLIDGFDEVAQIFSPEDKRARQQKALLETTLQSPCDTILTSRGYSLPPKDSFHYDLRLVNQGFTDQQVQRYIEQYFSSLPKPDEKLAKTIQQLVQQNQRFQSLVHNPLILALACDFYRDAYENGSTNLQQL